MIITVERWITQENHINTLETDWRKKINKKIKSTIIKTCFDRINFVFLSSKFIWNYIFMILQSNEMYMYFKWKMQLYLSAYTELQLKESQAVLWLFNLNWGSTISLNIFDRRNFIKKIMKSWLLTLNEQMPQYIVLTPLFLTNCFIYLFFT